MPPKKGPETEALPEPPPKAAVIDPAQRSSSTKDRLDSVMSRFEKFDVEMKVGTRQRREKDEHKIFQMQQRMTVIERKLNTEIKRRGEMNKSMQEWGDQQITSMCQRFAMQVADRRKEIQERVDVIRDRITELEARFAIDIEKIPIDIEERGKALAARLHRSMEQFEEESKDRIEREAVILTREADHESFVAKGFNSDRTTRENAYVEIRTQLEDGQKVHAKKDEKFKSLVDAEVARLKNAIVIESHAREREDDELADAMNLYIDKLQGSLKTVNSDAIE